MNRGNTNIKFWFVIGLILWFLYVTFCTGCNAAKKVIADAAAANVIANNQIAERVTTVRDSIIYVPSKKDTLIYTDVDTSTRVIRERYYITTHDSIKIYIQTPADAAQIDVLKNANATLQGTLASLTSVNTGYKKSLVWYIVALCGFALILGATIFFRLKF